MPDHTVSNLVDTFMVATSQGAMRDALGLGTLATQSGTFPQTTITGNAGTATKLAAPVSINGVAFDGSANIAIAFQASALTGQILSETVTASSLTAVGTLTTGVWQASIIAPAYLGSGVPNNTKFLRGDGSWQVVDVGTAGVTVQDEGVPLATTATTVNFVGTAVVASGTGATKTITINHQSLDGKVDKVTGKELSTNDFDNAAKDKLTNIAANANNYTLPAAGLSSIGGVMRTEGSAGQYIYGFDANGVPLRSTPASDVGGVTWGAITGTLTSQTDLNNALNAKAPLAGPNFTGLVPPSWDGTYLATVDYADATAENSVAEMTATVNLFTALQLFRAGIGVGQSSLGAVPTDGVISIFDAGSIFEGRITSSNLTNTRTWNFRDMDGDVAFVSDIGSAITAATFVQTLTESGTSRTLVLTDVRKHIRLTSSSPCTVTLPPQSAQAWADNDTIYLRVTDGIPVIVEGDGVIINNLAMPITRPSTVILRRTATSNLWDMDVITNISRQVATTAVSANGNPSTLTLNALNAGLDKRISLIGANPYDITVASGLPAGLVWQIRQAAAGVGTILLSGGTVNGPPKTAGQHTDIAVVHLGSNTVDVIGGAA